MQTKTIANKILLMDFPIQISDDLAVSISGSSVRLTPAMAIDVAEALLRKGCRRLVDEEIAARVEAVKQN